MKKILKAIWHEFIYGGHLTSIGAPSIAFATAIILGTTVHWPILVITYCGVESVYLFDRIKDLGKDNQTAHLRHIESRKFFLEILLIVTAVAVLVLPILEKKYFFLLFIASILFVSFLYTTILKPVSKKIIGFKSYLVSFMWSIIPIMYIIYEGSPIRLGVILFVTFLMFREIINTWFCDIKDIESDRANNLKTFANSFGKNKLITVLEFLNFVSVIPILVGVFLSFLPVFSISVLLVIGYVSLYLAKARKTDKSEFLFGFVPDIEPFLYFVFLLAWRGIGVFSS